MNQQIIDSNIISKDWAHIAAKFFGFALGLSIVIYFVVLTTNSKLNSLRIANQEPIILTATERTKQLDCLTRNIYWEAANEPFEGKVGVAQVTLNRLEDGRFGNSLCAVVYQKNIIYEKIICQFSWYCDNTHKTRPIHKELWKESGEVAKKVLLENFRLPSLKEALFYHATYIKPGWKKEKIAVIGQHIFYK